MLFFWTLSTFGSVVPYVTLFLSRLFPVTVKMTISSTKLTSKLHPEEFTSFLVILAVVLRLNLSHAPAVGMEISLKENRFCYQKQERLNWGCKNQQNHLSAVPLGWSFWSSTKSRNFTIRDSLYSPFCTLTRNLWFFHKKMSKALWYARVPECHAILKLRQNTSRIDKFFLWVCWHRVL